MLRSQVNQLGQEMSQSVMIQCSPSGDDVIHEPARWYMLMPGHVTHTGQYTVAVDD